MYTDDQTLPQAPLPQWTVIGFSGHRELDNRDVVGAKLQEVLQQLTQLYGYTITVSSAASGADTLFLERAEMLGLESSIILPFSEQEFEKDFDGESWLKAKTQLQRAFDVHTVEPCDSREEAYLETGVQTVERCDVLVCVWNGDVAAGIGGTGDVIKYAREYGRPLLIIDANTGALRAENFIEQLPVLGTTFTEPKAITLNAVKSAYDFYSSQSERHAPWSRWVSISIILLHLLAAAMAIVGAVLDFEDWRGSVVSVLKVGALVVAWLLVLVHHKNHHIWSSSRPAAELCRFYLAIWTLKRRSPQLKVAKANEFNQLARDLLITWQLDKSAACTLDDAKAVYLRDRVAHQLKYFQGKLKPSITAKFLTEKSTIVLTSLAIIGGAMVLLPDEIFSHVGAWYIVAKLASMILPLVVAALLSVMISQDSLRRSLRYKMMEAQLIKSEKSIKMARTWPSLWRSVEQLEYELLNEVEEWHALVRFSQSH